MRIARFRIENYKSFRSTQEIALTPSFNVIVGQNNVGKTALAQALSLTFSDQPHLSLYTKPTPLTALMPQSKVEATFSFSTEGLQEILANDITRFDLNVPQEIVENESRLLEFFVHQVGLISNISATISGGGGISDLDPTRFTSNENVAATFTVRYSLVENRLDVEQRQNGLVGGNVIHNLAAALKSRVYYFKPERFTRGEYPAGSDQILTPDASNLAQVLSTLQSNPARFNRFNEYIRTIFPQLQRITVEPFGGNVRIKVWSIDPATERDDLAMSLSDSGTGIGQVLAILYVVMTSPYPRTIIIDEPQSFLHPGAIRKLIGILKQYYSQHQYIITTHSPTAVTAADPQTLLFVRKEEAESVIEAIDVSETQHLRIFLAEIGARLSDVFGADNILWVEGPTEEQTFPLILTRITNRPLLGTAIIHASTGDIGGKHKRTIFDIYRRLSAGEGLLPRAVGFVFDREGRTEQERNDLIRESRSTVYFTRRRMFENYLLNPRAIAAVASSIECFRDTPVVAQEVEAWLEQHAWDRDYFDKAIDEADRSRERWLEDVHGAKVLGRIFTELSEMRVNYDKVEHGVMLTSWLIDNKPDDLRELAELLGRILGPAN